MKEWICRELSTSTGNSENGVLTREKELIRCKDCKYWSKKYRWCGFNDTDVELDDFCSRAERRTDETD